MANLSTTWLTDGWVDLEYKKYTLLAYLQKVKEKFNQHKLYPQLSELIGHYNNLLLLKQNKELLFEQFPKQVSGFDLKHLRLTYDQLVKDDELMHQLAEIIHYALPQIDKTIHEGQALYDFVEENLTFDEVGLLPIYQREGYVLLTESSTKYLSVYRFRLSLITHNEEQFRAINTTFIGNELKSITNTVNKIKLGLINRFRELPNPATFLITSQLKFPLSETLLPIAKRLLIRNVDAG